MLLVLALAIMMLFVTMVFFMGMSRSIFGSVVMVLSLDLFDDVFVCDGAAEVELGHHQQLQMHPEEQSE